MVMTREEFDRVFFEMPDADDEMRLEAKIFVRRWRGIADLVRRSPEAADLLAALWRAVCDAHVAVDPEPLGDWHKVRKRIDELVGDGRDEAYANADHTRGGFVRPVSRP